jgi:hypothetical protein
LFRRVQAAVGDEGVRGRIRSLPTGTRILGAVAWAALIVSVTSFVAPRSGFGPVPVHYVVLVLTVLATLLAVLIRWSVRPLQASPPERRGFVAAFAAGLAVPVLFAVITPPGAAFARNPVVGEPAAAIGCFVIGAFSGALLVFGLRLLDRGASSSTGLTAAVAGGLLGNAALELHCPVTAPMHLLTGHASVGFALLLVMALLGRRAA